MVYTCCVVEEVAVWISATQKTLSAVCAGAPATPWRRQRPGKSPKTHGSLDSGQHADAATDDDASDAQLESTVA